MDASAALQAQAEAAADTEDEGEEGEEGEEAEIPAAVSGQVAGTYVFASVEDYEAFEGEARALGLPDTYAVSSADVTQFEQAWPRWKTWAPSPSISCWWFSLSVRWYW